MPKKSYFTERIFRPSRVHSRELFMVLVKSCGDGHGVIGDRRTGAMVAADGTLNWCRQEHQHHGSRQLIPKDGPRLSGGAFLKLIGAMLDKAAPRLFGQEPLGGIDLQPSRQFFCAELMRSKPLRDPSKMAG